MDSQNNLESSRLLPLIQKITSSIKQSPDAFIGSLIPPDKAKVFMAMKGLGSTFGFDPSKIITGLLEKIESQPEHFWIQLEHVLQDFLNGDPDAEAIILEFLGTKSQ